MDEGPTRLVLMSEPVFEEYISLLRKRDECDYEVDWGDPVLPPGLTDRRLLYEPTVTRKGHPRAEPAER